LSALLEGRSELRESPVAFQCIRDNGDTFCVNAFLFCHKIDQRCFLIQGRCGRIVEPSGLRQQGSDPVDLPGQTIQGHEIFKCHSIAGIVIEQLYEHLVQGLAHSLCVCGHTRADSLNAFDLIFGQAMIQDVDQGPGCLAIQKILVQGIHKHTCCVILLLYDVDPGQSLIDASEIHI